MRASILFLLITGHLAFLEVLHVGILWRKSQNPANACISPPPSCGERRSFYYTVMEIKYMCFPSLPQEFLSLPSIFLRHVAKSCKFYPLPAISSHARIQDALASKGLLGNVSLHPYASAHWPKHDVFWDLSEIKESSIPFAVPCAREILARGACAGYDKLSMAFIRSRS